MASYAFCNNKGGSGKTFMLYQAAAEMARANPQVNVLVLDFSLYSDTSALLMGGLARENILSPTRGLEAVVNATTSDTRAEGMLRDLMDACSDTQAAPVSLFGRIFGGSVTAQAEFDLTKYILRPSDTNPRIPDNLLLVPSAGSHSWANPTDTEQPWWTSHGEEWEPAGQRLRQALSTLPGEWIVLVDTDHLAASPLTKLALSVVNNTIVPISLDEGDFDRLFADPTDNALITDVMAPMAHRHTLTAPVSKFVFTKLSSTSNNPTTTPMGIKSPMKPAAAVQSQMDTIAQAILEALRQAPELQGTIKDFDQSCRTKEFAEKYFTTFKTVSDLASNTSKLCGAPICTMQHDDATLGDSKTRPDSKVLTALKQELGAIVAAIEE